MRRFVFVCSLDENIGMVIYTYYGRSTENTENLFYRYVLYIHPRTEKEVMENLSGRVSAGLEEKGN